VKKRVLYNHDAKFQLATVNPTTGDAGGNLTTLTGYALVWNVLSSDRGGYFVRLLPGSATFLTPTFALYNHDYGAPLARNDDGTLRITSDDYGVKVEIDVPNTTLGRDLQTLIARQTIRGMSFAMVPGGESETTTEDGQEIITFSKFDADEVTITAIPAFDDTSIIVKPNEENGLSTNLLQLKDYTKELSKQYQKLEQYKLDSYRF
jgi:HK97 family phage prohead protease